MRSASVVLGTLGRENVGGCRASPTVRGLGASQLRQLTSRKIVLLISVSVLGTTEGFSLRSSLMEGHPKVCHVGQRL